MVDYSKWDNLEISDDSDIEVHPNVDKRSMIKWKQEAIHRERAERKAKMDYLTVFIPQQRKTLKNLQEFSRLLNKGPTDEDGIKRVVAALDEQQSKADPAAVIPGKDNKESINLAQVFATMKAQIVTGLQQTTPTEVKKTLLERFAQTETTVQKTVDEASKELEKLQKEAGKKLTSENMFTSEKSNKTVSSRVIVLCFTKIAYRLLINPSLYPKPLKRLKSSRH
jgi:cell division cycle protein 37